MDSMRALRPAWLDLSLNTTFRCPKIIVSRSQAHAPGFRAADANIDGEEIVWQRVREPGEEPDVPARIAWLGEKHDGWSYKWLRAMRKSPEERIFILCRNNAPLLSLAFKLIRQGIGPLMLGRDIGANLGRLVDKIATKETQPISELVLLIRQWARNEIAKAELMDKEHLIEGIMDRSESLLAVVESSGVADARGLKRAIEVLFAKEHGEVTLATGHKIKGLEAEIVLHLDPHRIPSKFAARIGGTVLQQELNLRYVIETRTRRVYVEAQLEDFI